MESEIPQKLSAKFKDSFAYETMSRRVPEILTQAIDTVYQWKNTIPAQYGPAASADLKSIAGKLSMLKTRLQTDKQMERIEDSGSDVTLWNDYLDRETEKMGAPPSCFTTDWLYVECYTYRKVAEAFKQSAVLQHLDPFRQQKENSFIASQEAILSTSDWLVTLTDDAEHIRFDILQDIFRKFIEVDLWGNKCDLSISSGQGNYQTQDPMAQLDLLKDNILADNLDSIWQYLHFKRNTTNSIRLDIVLDNAGFEIVTDFILAEFLLVTKLVDVVHFHGKKIPWFVSDVTKHDFDWHLEMFQRSNSLSMSKLGQRWSERIADSTWVYRDHDFWTLPHDYSHMKTTAPDLYAELSKSSLILFKGDMNFRKLTCDRMWEPTELFERSLCGFHPAPLFTLRTLKADLVVGLAEGVAEATKQWDENWMINGQWAVILFCPKIVL